MEGIQKPRVSYLQTFSQKVTTKINGKNQALEKLFSLLLLTKFHSNIYTPWNLLVIPNFLPEIVPEIFLSPTTGVPVSYK